MIVETTGCALHTRRIESNVVRRSAGAATKWSIVTLVLISCLLLPGCHRQFRMRLATQAERIPNPTFVVEDTSQPGSRARYHTVRMLDGEGKVLWHLRAEPFTYKNSAKRITYGDRLPGYVTVVSPTPLEAGRSYALVVSGRGTGVFRFAVDSLGTVHAD
ncbi:MAG: hypothetical protein ACE5HE_02775 [Phycisphaerae bacterium]